MVQKTAKFRVSSVKHRCFFVCLAGWLVCWFKKINLREGLLVVSGGGDVFVCLFVCLFLLLLLVCVCVLLFLVVFCRPDITALVDWA